MPIPMSVARFNRAVTNRLTSRVAGRLPGFALVVHRGRTSGQEYRTPVNAFLRSGGYALALTYGSRADWVRNVLAAGAAVLETEGRRVPVTNPRVVRDAARRFVSLPARLVLRAIGVDQFLLLDTAPGGLQQSPP